MTHTMPPELLSPEDREARADELRRRIGREWLRYALIEGVVLGIPSIVFVALWLAMDVVSDSAAIVVVLILSVSCLLFFAYWYMRVSPLSRELKVLEEHVADDRS